MSNRRDVLLKKEFTLPTAAGAATSEVFDLQAFDTPNDIRDEHYQLEVRVPALTEAELPAGASLIVEIESSDSGDFSEPVTMLFEAITGASDALRFAAKPSEKSKRFWRAKITSAGDGVGDLSMLTAVFEIVF